MPEPVAELFSYFWMVVATVRALRYILGYPALNSPLQNKLCWTSCKTETNQKSEFEIVKVVQTKV